MKKYLIIFNTIIISAFIFSPGFVFAADTFTTTGASWSDTVSVAPPASGTYQVSCNDWYGLTDLVFRDVTLGVEFTTTYISGSTFTAIIPSGVNIGDTIISHAAGNDEYGYGCGDATVIWTCTSGSCDSSTGGFAMISTGSPINNSGPTKEIAGKVFNEVVYLPLFMLKNYETPLMWIAMIFALVVALFGFGKFIELF